MIDSNFLFQTENSSSSIEVIQEWCKWEKTFVNDRWGSEQRPKGRVVERKGPSCLLERSLQNIRKWWVRSREHTGLFCVEDNLWHHYIFVNRMRGFFQATLNVVIQTVNI